MKSLLITVFALIAVAYPFVVLFGLTHFGPSLLGLALLVILISRAFLSKGASSNSTTNAGRNQMVLLAIMAIFCLSVAISDSLLILKFYPVLMSLGMASLFFLSLFDTETMIEKFARLAGNEIDKTVKRYTRNVTKIWIVALLFNASVAAFTVCCVSLKFWTYYNGFISYVLFGVLIVVEFIYRYFYKKRHQLK